ncbi:SUMF1/EgtB/PvdO family nonheme iron enzyme [Metabacillus niabensis]|uniref:SUMF1/EgtB/PvdO family nonheme iron enzyme n=1 Tax=Metabacillus niabensis TaxID=324854 RepID=UPI0039A1694C
MHFVFISFFIWHGEFPSVNHEDDSYYGKSPMDSYEANDFGHYHMSGNVWEWCLGYL